MSLCFSSVEKLPFAEYKRFPPTKIVTTKIQKSRMSELSFDYIGLNFFFFVFFVFVGLRPAEKTNYELVYIIVGAPAGTRNVPEISCFEEMGETGANKEGIR